MAIKEIKGQLYSSVHHFVKETLGAKDDAEFHLNIYNSSGFTWIDVWDGILVTICESGKFSEQHFKDMFKFYKEIPDFDMMDKYPESFFGEPYISAMFSVSFFIKNASESLADPNSFLKSKDYAKELVILQALALLDYYTTARKKRKIDVRGFWV